MTPTLTNPLLDKVVASSHLMVTGPDVELLAAAPFEAAVHDGVMVACYNGNRDLFVPLFDASGNDGGVSPPFRILSCGACHGRCPCALGSAPTIHTVSTEDRGCGAFRVVLEAFDPDGDLTGFYVSRVTGVRVLGDDEMRLDAIGVRSCTCRLALEAERPDACSNAPPSLQVLACDLQGNGAVRTIQPRWVANQPPVLTGGGATCAVAPGETISIPVAAQDPDAACGDYALFTADPVPAVAGTLALTPAPTFAAAPTACAQTVAVRFVATDRCGAATSKVIPIRIESSASAPTISHVVGGAGLDEATRARCADLTVSVIDADLRCPTSNEVVVFQAVPEDAGARLWHLDSTGSWWPVESAGPAVVLRPGGETFSFRYFPPPGREGGLVTLVAEDSQGHIVSQTIRVALANDPPVGLPIARVAIRFSSLHPLRYALEPAWYESGCLRFTDPNGDPLSFRLGRFPTKGQVSLLSAEAKGQYSVTCLYEVNRDEAMKAHRGTEPYIDRFTVVAEDPFGAQTATQVELTVDVANTPPTCAADSVTTQSSTSVYIDVVANDTDPDQDILTLTAVTAPAHGTAAIVAGAVTYAPAKGYVGSDTFTYMVADGYGGAASGQVTVTVLDAEPPAFSWDPPFAGALPNDAGVCGAAVTWEPPTIGIDVTDNVGVASLTSSHAPGSTFPVGSTVVVYTAQDPSGNESSFAFIVDIEDAEAPVLHGLPADVVTAAAEGETTKAVSWIPATATDNCGVSSLSSSHSPGFAFPIGATVVTTAATDVHGNKTAGTFLVTVHPPLAIVVHDVEVTTTRDDGDHVTFAVEVVGGCPPVTVECAPESGALFTIGATPVTVTAADSCGTVVARSLIVNVIHEAENGAPIARDDRPPDMTTNWILVHVLLNDDDPDGDEISLVSIGAPPCGDAIPSGPHPGAIYYVAADCDAYKGRTIAFDYTIADQHGARAAATIYLRIPDDIVLPRAPAGGGD